MKKMTPKRHGSNTPAAAVQAVQSAAMGPLPPPSFVAVRDADRPFWDVIVLARPRDTWTRADLVLAGQLARAYGDIRELETHIDETGLLVAGKANPAVELLDKVTRRALAIGRQLKIDTISTVGKAEDVRKPSALAREAAQEDDDDLIPRAAP